MTTDTRTTDEIIAAANERARRAERRERRVKWVLRAAAIAYGLQLSAWVASRNPGLLGLGTYLVAIGAGLLPPAYVEALFWWVDRRASRREES